MQVGSKTGPAQLMKLSEHLMSVNLYFGLKDPKYCMTEKVLVDYVTEALLIGHKSSLLHQHYCQNGFVHFADMLNTCLYFV